MSEDRRTNLVVFLGTRTAMLRQDVENARRAGPGKVGRVARASRTQGEVVGILEALQVLDGNYGVGYQSAANHFGVDSALLVRLA